jgi:uncharacterized protein DUF3800
MCVQSQDSKIDEFVRMVHPRDGHKKVFAMIDAYLDESGIHDGSKVCVIAGYFGGPGQMKRFEKAWKKTLAEYSFPMKDFHAKDVLKIPKHAPMLRALAKLAGEQPKVYPVAFGIVVDDFYAFSKDERRFLTGAMLGNKSGKLSTSGCPSKPYFCPFQQVIKIVTGYAPVGGKAHFSFGVNRPFAEYALALFKQMHAQNDMEKPWSTWNSRHSLGEPFFPSAEETAPLQAADLLVHLVYLHMTESIQRGEHGTFSRVPSELAALCMANVQDRAREFVCKQPNCPRLGSHRRSHNY